VITNHRSRNAVTSLYISDGHLARVAFLTLSVTSASLIGDDPVAETYLRSMWYPDPFSRLAFATIHQRYRQDRQTGQTTVS